MGLRSRGLDVFSSILKLYTLKEPFPSIMGGLYRLISIDELASISTLTSVPKAAEGPRDVTGGRIDVHQYVYHWFILKEKGRH